MGSSIGSGVASFFSEADPAFAGTVIGRSTLQSHHEPVVARDVPDGHPAASPRTAGKPDHGLGQSLGQGSGTDSRGFRLSERRSSA